MTIPTDDSVLQRALDQGMLSVAQLEAARSVINCQGNAAGSASRLIEQLVSTGGLTAWQVARLRAEEFGFEIADLAGVTVAEGILALVPRPFAERFGLMPLSRHQGVLRVAVSDPLDTDGSDQIALLTGLQVETIVADTKDIARAIERNYGRSATAEANTLADSSLPAEAGESLSDPVEKPEGESDAPVITLVHDVIREAIARRASDIHWEPLEKSFRVRLRIDGSLVELSRPPHRLRPAIVSRLKIMANINIAQKRIPQDGRIQFPQAGRPVGLRVSTLPTVHGESVVMRILDGGGRPPGLTDLGLEREDLATLERLVALPDGILLVTGPTGSGKTSTLYGCLQHLNRSDRKIITVEDPVEYQLGGINQVPVRADIGMTFAAALRAMLRQAPNVVMVGEIRDRETAEIAVNASLTGHMVFSTLHTNDAPGAITRLVDIGVKPFLLAASVRAVVAQRLVRKICPHCRRQDRPPPAELRALGLDPEQLAGATFMRGAGCPACHGTGFLGRLGIFEIFVINEELQQLIHDRAGPARLRAKARLLGMRTLREDGVRKVSAGLTTAGEVVSITVGDASQSNLPHPP